MDTIYVKSKISFYMYNKIMHHLIKKIEEGCSLLNTKTEMGEVHNLQTEFGTYSRFELNNTEPAFAFAGSWDISPECERNFAFYYGVFKTPNFGGHKELSFDGCPQKVFLDRNRFLKVACGLYETARGVVDCKLDMGVFYMWDANEVVYIEEESILRLFYNETEQVLEVYRFGDFESLSTEGYSTILEIGGVSFYAPETKTE